MPSRSALFRFAMRMVPDDAAEAIIGLIASWMWPTAWMRWSRLPNGTSSTAQAQLQGWVPRLA